WTNDDARRTKAGVPEAIEFRTKPQIALEQVKCACAAGVPRGVVIIDAGYGVEAKVRNEISSLKLKYVAGVKTAKTLWMPDALASPRPGKSRGSHDENKSIHAAQSRPTEVRNVGYNKAYVPLVRPIIAKSDGKLVAVSQTPTSLEVAPQKSPVAIDVFESI